MQRRDGNSATLVWLAFGVSAALHAAIAVFFIHHRSDTHGVAAPPSEAISVNIETSDILNSPEEDEQAADSKAADYVPEVQESKPIQEAETDTAPPPEPEAKESAEKAKAEAEAKRLEEERERERLAQEEAQRLREQQEAERQEAERLRKKEEEARLAEQRLREEREAERREAERRKVEQAERIARKEARKRRENQRGQNAAEASKGKQASRGRVSASRGSVLNYRTTVRAHVARNTSKHSNKAGRAIWVDIRVSASGALAFARISKSSGDSTLDQNALATVRRSSPFPPPPQGATAAQLTYTLRFNYR